MNANWHPSFRPGGPNAPVAPICTSQLVNLQVRWPMLMSVSVHRNRTRPALMSALNVRPKRVARAMVRTVFKAIDGGHEVEKKGERPCTG